MPRSTNRRSDRGATLVEYSLLVALIAVVAIGALSFLGDNSAAAFAEAEGAVDNGVIPPTGPGPSNPGPSNPGPSNPGPSNPGPSNPGPSNPGPSNPGPSDPGPGDDADVGGEDTEPGDEEDPPVVDDPPVEESSSGWATRNGESHNWDAHAEFQLKATDGQPLPGSALVEFEVVEGGFDEHGEWVEKVSTESKTVYNGTLSLRQSTSDKDPKNKNDHQVTTVTFKVLRVVSSSGEWDGTAGPVQVLAPEGKDEKDKKDKGKKDK